MVELLSVCDKKLFCVKEREKGKMCTALQFVQSFTQAACKQGTMTRLWCSSSCVVLLTLPTSLMGTPGPQILMASPKQCLVTRHRSCAFSLTLPTINILEVSPWYPCNSTQCIRYHHQHCAGAMPKWVTRNHRHVVSHGWQSN